MKIGLLGGYGQLGSQIRRTASDANHQVIAPSSTEVDITNAAELSDWVQTTNADAWVNAAAYTAVDAAEDNEALAHKINATGAMNFARALSAREATTPTPAPLIFFSTDYVFAGNAGAPYSEKDPTDPQSVYGSTKLAGEEASLSYSTAYVLRISWVFGRDGHNFVKAILRAARRFDSERDGNGQTQSLRVVDDQLGAPCSTASICQTVLALLSAKAEPGVYHLASQPHVNWHQFATAIIEDACELGLLAQSVEVLKQPTSALNQKAKRPPDGRLDSTKLSAALGLTPPLWRDELRTMLRELSPEQLDG